MTAVQTTSGAWNKADTRWKIVLERLLHGYEVDIKAGGRIWPAGYKTTMPQYLLDHPRRPRNSRNMTARDLSLADESRPWAGLYVRNEDLRLTLQVCVYALYHGLKRKQLAERQGTKPEHLDWQVEIACRQIVDGLDADGVEIR